MKAKVIIKGDIAILENEYGGKSVIPLQTLCNVARRLKLELTNYDGCMNANSIGNKQRKQGSSNS